MMMRWLLDDYITSQLVHGSLIYRLPLWAQALQNVY